MDGGGWTAFIWNGIPGFGLLNCGVGFVLVEGRDPKVLSAPSGLSVDPKLGCFMAFKKFTGGAGDGLAVPSAFIFNFGSDG